MRVLHQLFSCVAVLGLFWAQAAAQQSPSQAVPSNETEKPVSSPVATQTIEVGRPLHLMDPVVPKNLRKKNLATVLYGTIAMDGSFENLAVVGGDPVLTAAALDAVRQWRYTPATQDGRPIELRT